MESFGELISGFAFRDSQLVVKFRVRASSKDFDYDTRLFYDKLAARYELSMINYADQLIRRKT